MIIKVCGVTNIEDAMAAAEAGATAIGLNFYPRSPRYIRPERAAEVVAQLPASVLRVGVFVNARPEQVLQTVQAVGLDVVQLHGDEGPEQVPVGLRVWKAFRVEPGWHAEVINNYNIEAVVLDSAGAGEYGGTGRTFPWELARGLDRRVILAGGLDGNNVRKAIRLLRPWGVDACSRLERAPGIKDHYKMIRFIQAAREEMEAWR